MTYRARCAGRRWQQPGQLHRRWLRDIRRAEWKLQRIFAEVRSLFGGGKDVAHVDIDGRVRFDMQDVAGLERLGRDRYG